MMHTPELQALLEAVRKHKDYSITTFPIDSDMYDAYDAYMASLTTPPSCLPPAPKGEKWVRVEYPNGWPDVRNGDRIVFSIQGHARVLMATSAGNYVKGVADGTGHGWRLIVDPEADSLEKIADEIESSGVGGNMAQRIRALIGEGQK